MRKLRPRGYRDERGFTLIELMIVILVILVLAAILIPQFSLARERARKATCVSNQRNLETAISMWQADNPSVALTGGALTAAVPSATTLTGTQYVVPGQYAEPDDSGVTDGSDYWLAAGAATNPSYGHIACRYAFAEGADPWIGSSGETENGTGGAGLNHARGQSASP